MKKSRFTEAQIIGVLREQKARMKTADVYRKHGISPATFYQWKAKFGGLEVSEARRLRMLEAENARLMKLLGTIMKCVPTRLWVASPRGTAQRAAVLACVKPAARRLRRWPSARLDPGCARLRGGLWPDRKTALNRTEKHRQDGPGGHRELC
jgi:putative transposase